MPIPEAIRIEALKSPTPTGIHMPISVMPLLPNITLTVTERKKSPTRKQYRDIRIMRTGLNSIINKAYHLANSLSN